jgi:hypothetical protein
LRIWRICSRSTCSRWRSSNSFLRLVADLLREPQHFDALAQRCEHPVQAPAQIEALEHFLLLLAGDVEKVRDHVGQQAGRGHGFDDRRQLFRRIGQQVDRLDLPAPSAG